MLTTQTIKSLLTHFLWAFLLLVGAKNVVAQQDTLFYFAAPDISSAEGDTPIYLRFMSYGQPANITVSQPANGAFAPINLTLGANDLDSINLTSFLADIESPSANSVNSNGLKIVSDQIISVFYELKANGNRTYISLKGNKGLGKEFYTPFQKDKNLTSTSPASYSGFEIVAAENNTTVLITPRANITGHSMNSTFSVVLNEGETYSARETDLVSTTSLAGSIVSSDKNVSVTVFEGAVTNNGCTSTISDQITSVNYLGRNFILPKTTGQNEIAYVLAIQNNTQITVTNSSVSSTVINFGETFTLPVSDAINYISSNKPIYLLKVGGNGCNLSETQMAHIFCAGKYDQAFTRTSGDSLGLMVYTRAGFEDDFTINGNATLLTATDFSPVPGTSNNFVYTLKYFNSTQIPLHSYNILSNTEDVFGLAVISGSNGNGSAMSFISEFQSYPFINAGVDITTCANAPVNIQGIVGGGSVTGSWGTNGFGSFDNGLTSLDNIYTPSNLDTIISPINIILSSTGPCPVQKDTLLLTVTPAPIVSAGADQVLCGNNANVQLNGEVSGATTTGQWTSSGSGSFSPGNTNLNGVYIPSSSDTAMGQIQLILTSTNNNTCSAESDTSIITFTDAPVANAGTDTVQVCENNPNVSLNGSISGGGSTGKWTSAGSGIFSPNNQNLQANYQPSINDINAGMVWLYLESTNNGNCIKAKDSLLVQFTPKPFVNAGADIISCTNDSEVNLNGIVSGPTTTGQWMGGNGSFSPGNNNLNAVYTPTASEVSAGSMILTLNSTNNGGCNAVNDQVQINFVAPPFANFNASNVCEGNATAFSDFSLNGFGSITNWNWNFGDSQTSSQENPSHNYNGFGSYNVELIVESNTGCSDTVIKTVEVYENPVSDFSWQSNCNGNQVTVNFQDQSSSSSSTINSWFYDFGGQGTQAVQNPVELFNGIGNFTITQIVQTNEGCADTSSQVLTIDPKPDAGFLINTSNGLNIGAQFSFIDTSDYSVSYFWNLGNGETSSAQNASTTYFENGQYIVTQYVYNAAGCVDSLSRIIIINTVTTEIDLLIPNAISPNGDGRNDIWKLQFLDFINAEAEVTIFNRWGQQIFQSIGYDTPFDGRYNGELLPEGTYYYVIKISESEIYKGTLLIYTGRKE